jgi:hypothetical protein
MSLLPLLGILSSAIFSGTSLLYTTLGEIIDERSGIVNLGLEGVLLVSASSGFAVTVVSGNPYLGVLVAIHAGRRIDEHDPGLPGDSPSGESIGQRPGADVLRLWPERLDRQAVCGRQD